MLRKYYSLLSFYVLFAIVGCASWSPTEGRLSEDVVRPEKSIIVISPDGMDHVRFHELLAAGKLPFIKKVFVDGGVGVAYAVNCLPTVTYANYSSLITGRFPGHHDIMSNLWFDRRTLWCAGYMTLATYRTVNEHLSVPTLYDILSDHFTVNLQCHTRRGVTYSIDNSRRFAWAWIIGQYMMADKHVVDTFDEVIQAANRMGRWPSVITTYYPGVDEIGHRYGPNSAEYEAALKNIDDVVGLLVDAVERAGLSEITHYVLVTDHGMPPVEPKKHFDIRRWLRKQRGLKYLSASLSGGADSNDYMERYDEISAYDAFVSVGADRHAAIHLRGNRGWAFLPEASEVESFIKATPALHKQSAVDCVVMRAGTDRVKMLSSRGSVIVERQGCAGSARYRMSDRQGSPLGYDRYGEELSGFVEDSWHSSREWLQATAKTERPDFVPQVVEMFDSSRTADVMVFAADGWDFSTWQKGAHGSCLARDMRVTMYFAGPGLPKGGSIPYARIVDFAPTIVGLLGEAERLERVPFMDGINLADEIKAAKSTYATSR